MNQQRVEQRAYHGKVDPEDMARALVLRFDAGETQARWMREQEGGAIVQVQSRRVEHQDPTMSVTVQIVTSDTGVVVAMSEQKSLGVLADLAKTGVKAWLNPRRLLGEIDDVARNVRWLNLRTELWQAVEDYCQSSGSGRGAAQMLQKPICAYCGTPNEIGAANCQACRAPLTEVQPMICNRCGFLNDALASLCVNCGATLQK
ncbi:MAG: zinc ribbon domain-containing protein [Anaerolineae bacterium]|nr:zinc ribbon domain-containing protein [Anaerolineae bacterium]